MAAQGGYVTAAQAAWLVNRAERVVRWHIARGDLPAQKRGRGWAIASDDLERIDGWKVNRARLAELAEQDARTQEGMATQIASLRRDVDSLKARLALLERREALAGRAEAPASDADSLPALRPLARPRSEAYALTYAPGASAQGRFKSYSDAARWLLPHGVNSVATPKTWPGWGVTALEKRDILALAISLCDPNNHRIRWRLHRCEDGACVCQEMLVDIIS